jgi:predicted nucleotidyltransferase component of viral defense system
VIPAAVLTHWRSRAPWSDDAQVEQDLVLARVLVELFADPEVAGLVAFRGGTALHMLLLPEPMRYSEDIDLVQRSAGPIRPLLAAIQRRLDPWLGRPAIDQRTDAWRMTYRFTAETGVTRKVKVEINTREHGSVDGWTAAPFTLSTAWFSGTAAVTTFSPAEILATKLRALYQRRKGRDLFDLEVALTHLDVDDAAVVRIFERYLQLHGHTVSRSAFESNLDAKLAHPLFLADTQPLLRRDLTYDPALAAERIKSRLLARLP